MALDYVMMPRATYCQPQVASFGWTEAQARERGHDVRVAKFPFMANGKAHGLGDTAGFVKLVSDAEYGELLGAHLIGPDVTELLPELTLAQQWDLTVHGAGPQRARPPDPERGGQGGAARPRGPHDQHVTCEPGAAPLRLTRWWPRGRATRRGPPRDRPARSVRCCRGSVDRRPRAAPRRSVRANARPSRVGARKRRAPTLRPMDREPHRHDRAEPVRGRRIDRAADVRCRCRPSRAASANAGAAKVTGMEVAVDQRIGYAARRERREAPRQI